MAVEGPVSRHINRRVSVPVARALVRTPVTPNQVSAAAFVMALGSLALLAAGRNIEAGLLVQASSIVDGVDGDLARAKGAATRFGGLFDATLDRLADAAIAGGMAWWALEHEGMPAPLVVGLAATVGFLLVSYSRARLEGLGGGAAVEAAGPGSRDVRLLALAAAAVVGRCWWGLLVVGAASYATLAWRLFRFRHAR